MGILDRYVLRLYLNVLLISFVSLTGLFIVVDAFNNLDEFISYSKQSGGPVAILGAYYGARTLWFFDRMNGVLGMVAAMFTLTMMQRSNEMTALMAAGISRARVVQPLIGAAIFVAVLGLVNREFGLPNVRDKLTRNAQDWMGDVQKECHPKYDPQTDILLTGKHTLAKEKRIDQPHFRLPPEMSSWGKTLAGEQAFFEAKNDVHPNGYRVRQVRLPSGVKDLPSFALQERTILFSPKEHAWLQPDECFVASEVSFEQLYVGNGWRQYLSSLELFTGLHARTLENGADVLVTMHSRLIQPVLDVVLLFLGVPLILGRENRNIVFAAGQCLGLTLGFFMVTLACQSLGTNYLLNPVLAAWLPLMIFAPLAYVLSRPLWD